METIAMLDCGKRYFNMSIEEREVQFMQVQLED